MKSKSLNLFLIALLLLTLFERWDTKPVLAQTQACDQTIAINVAAAATQTIAGAIPGATIYVCGGVISADTIATTGAFSSGSTALTGAMRLCDECNIPMGDGSAIIFQTPNGGNLTLAAVTGAITGYIRIGQH